MISLEAGVAMAKKQHGAHALHLPTLVSMTTNKLSPPAATAIPIVLLYQQYVTMVTELLKSA